MPESLPSLNEHAGMIAICRSRRHRSVRQVHLAREMIDNVPAANADLNIEDDIDLRATLEPRTDDKITGVDLSIGRLGLTSR